jgi:hypothetical protein
MKKMLVFFVVILAVFAGLYFFVFRKKSSGDDLPKDRPVAVSTHSAAFNTSLQQLMDAYYNMSEGFVNWDTTIISQYSAVFKTAADSLKMDELKKDTVIYETAVAPWETIKSEINSIIQDPDLGEKRGSLNIISQSLYDLLRVVKYDQSKIYFQECPMAFGDDKPGNWISATAAVRNPYLGTQDPKYKDKMLTCGGPKDSLDFMPADSTKK